MNVLRIHDRCRALGLRTGASITVVARTILSVVSRDGPDCPSYIHPTVISAPVLTLCLCLSAFDWLSAECPCQQVRADEVTPVAPAKSHPDADVSDDKAAGRKIEPDRFHEVDDAARLLVWMGIASGLGAVVLLTLILVGARRLRRLTRSTALKSKYAELEDLRAKYRREMEGLETPPPSNREARR